MKAIQRKVDGRCDGACPCREKISKGTVLAGCACVLLAYFIYNIYRYANQPAVTVVLYEDQQSLTTPGIILCPPDSVDTTRQFGVFPQVFFQSITDQFYLLNNNCTFFPAVGAPSDCAYRASLVEYRFSTIEVTNRTCYDVPPGALTMTDSRDSMWLSYWIFQAANTSLPGNGLTTSNNLFYGLYTDESDRSNAPIRLASASGITVVAFQVDVYKPYGGGSHGIKTYSVFSSSSTANRPEASLVFGPNATFPGTNIPVPPSRLDSGLLILQPAALSITVHEEQHLFSWTDVLGAIGGVFSIVMSAKTFLNGDETDPEQEKGFIRRVFYPSDVSAAQAAESDSKGAKLNSELEELRRRAQYNDPKHNDTNV